METRNASAPTRAVTGTGVTRKFQVPDENPGPDFRAALSSLRDSYGQTTDRRSASKSHFGPDHMHDDPVV